MNLRYICIIYETKSISLQVDNIDTKLITTLSYTCRGFLAPLAAAVGGIVAQEVLKALTGKFTPLKQWVRPLKCPYKECFSKTLVYICFKNNF